MTETGVMGDARGCGLSFWDLPVTKLGDCRESRLWDGLEGDCIPFWIVHADICAPIVISNV